MHPNTLLLSCSVLQVCSNTFDERFTVEWSYISRQLQLSPKYLHYFIDRLFHLRAD